MMQIGTYVERDIEGIWFAASVIEYNAVEDTVTLRYVDDDNVEEGVPLDEVRLASQHDELKSEAKTSERTKRPAAKALEGMEEDDSEERNRIVPQVTVHQSVESERAIIINGAENKLAVGGGLRALRYLKS
jgi:hypothetical protein